MKRYLSLFDYTGTWPSEFARNGDDVRCWDLKDGQDVKHFDSVETTLDTTEHCDGVMAAPPCTDYSASGAQYWKVKDADGRTEASDELVNVVLQLVNLFYPTDPDFDGTFFWAIENPVGRIAKRFPQIGSPWYFQPWEYAGWLDVSDADLKELDRIRAKVGIAVTTAETEFVISRNAYTKKTGLWGEFNKDLEKRPIEPVRCAAQGSPLMRLGGSSARTKELRSMTPLGFSKAFYQANKSWRPTEWLDHINYPMQL